MIPKRSHDCGVRAADDFIPTGSQVSSPGELAYEDGHDAKIHWQPIEKAVSASSQCPGWARIALSGEQVQRVR